MDFLLPFLLVNCRLLNPEHYVVQHFWMILSHCVFWMLCFSILFSISSLTLVRIYYNFIFCLLCLLSEAHTCHLSISQSFLPDQLFGYVFRFIKLSSAISILLCNTSNYIFSTIMIILFIYRCSIWSCFLIYFIIFHRFLLLAEIFKPIAP